MPRGKPVTPQQVDEIKRAFSRAQGIGGSDVAAILGISPWRSAWDVWAEKTGDPSFTPQEESAAMRFGSLMEKVLADVYEQDHPGRKIRMLGGAHTDPIWHPNRINYAHIDGTISGDEEGVWEGKTARNDREWQEGVPEYYKAQVHSYLAVTQEKWCDVTVFFRDTATFAHYRIESDPATEAGIIAASEKFWNENVVPCLPPPVDGSPGASRYLSAKYPASTTDDLLAYERDFAVAVDTLLLVRSKIAGYGEQEARLINVLKSHMGEYPRAEGPGWSVTWKRSKGKEIVGWQEIASAYRGLLHQIQRSLEADRPKEALNLLTDNPADGIVGLYTRTVEGSRPFVVRSLAQLEGVKE